VVGQGGSWPLLPVVPRTTKFFARGSAPISLSRFHCVALFCPVDLLLPVSLREGLPFARRVGRHSALARPRSRRAETPLATTQQCGPGWGPSLLAGGPASAPPSQADGLDPPCPPRAAAEQRLARSARDRSPDTPPRIRTLGTPWPPERWPLAPAGRNLSTHPQTRLTPLKQGCGGREGGGENRPAGEKSHGAEACGHRAGVSRWGIAGAASCEQRGAPPRSVPPRSRAQTGRRARLDAQPERPLTARGAKKRQPPRNGMKRTIS